MNKKVICDTKVINKKPEIITTIEKNRIEKEFKKIMCSNGNVDNKCCILCK